MASTYGKCQNCGRRGVLIRNNSGKLLCAACHGGPSIPKEVRK